MAKMKNLMPSIHPAATSPLHRALAAGIALAVAGCSVVPEKITPEQVASRVQSDQSQMYKDQEAISGPVTFSAALARALKYNLDFRLKLIFLWLYGRLGNVIFFAGHHDLLELYRPMAVYRSQLSAAIKQSVYIDRNRLLQLLVKPYHLSRGQSDRFRQSTAASA